MNNHNEGTNIENPNSELTSKQSPINWEALNTESKSDKSYIRWEVIMTIAGLIMIIYAAIAIPGAGRIVDNEFVPSKFMFPLKSLVVIGLILFLIGIFKWLAYSRNHK